MKLRKSCVLFAAFMMCIQATADTWTNWLGNHTCQPHIYAEPKTLDELRSTILAAAQQHLHIKVAGNGYSISDIVCTDGLLLNLKNLNQILWVDAEQKQVRTEAGITLRDLNAQLAHHGLMLPNQPAIDTISLGGALSTAVHGTGHTGSISSFVTNLDLITADGLCHQLSATSDPEAFAAARTSLGALGAIYAVTLQCEPLSILTATTTTETMDHFLDEYPQHFEANDFLQLNWHVESNTATLTQWNRSTLGEQQTSLVWYTIQEEDKNDQFAEYTLPFETLPKALTAIQDLILRYKPFSITVTDVVIRFGYGDKEIYLSPSAGNRVVHLAFCTPREEGYLPLYRELEDLMRSFKGRPHWGKLNFLDHNKAVELYGENLAKFIAVKNKLDPNNVFSNSFTDLIFGINANP